MQRMRDQLFPGSRFAIDQHADRRARQAADNAEHILHRRRFANNIGGGAADRLIARLLLLLIVTNGALDQRYRLINIEGFRQIVERPLLISADGGVEIGVRRHNNDRQHRMTLFNLFQQRQPIHARHANI